MSDAPERPDRPLLPALLWALVAAIAISRAALSAPADPGRLAVASAAGGGALAAVLVALMRTRVRAAASAALVVVVAAACAGLACARELAAQGALADALSSSSVLSWELVVEGDMSEGAQGWRGRASALMGGRAAGSVWLVADEPLLMGDELRCVGRFSPNGDDEWGAASRAQGLAGTVRAVRVVERRPATGARGAVVALREAVLSSLDAASSDARALLAGTVCGSVSAMSARGLDEVFAACGVSHLVAVSGGHLVLVAAIATAALSRSRLPPPARACGVALATGAFVAFCGAPSSAVRAWAMSLVASCARLVGRRSHPLTAACAAAMAMALAEPGVTGQLGYLLSVLCVCGICALGPYARYLVRVVAPPPARGARSRAARVRAGAEEALSLTLVSQLVTAPLTCATFSQLSLSAPLANVALAPLFSALLVCGLAAAALVWAPPLQALALLACDAVGGVVVALARLVAALPLSSVAVSVEEGPALAALAALLAALLVWWPRASRATLVCGLCVLLACGAGWAARLRLAAPARVVVLDVGQGDAILVSDGAAAVLVDAGPGDAVVGALARAGVLHLDAVVLTHLHADHAGGLEDVLAAVPVGRVVVPEGTDPSALPDSVPLEQVGYGDELAVGRFSLAVVSPLEPAGGEGNEGSLELALSFDDGTRSLTALLAADAEVEETSAAVARGDVGDVDLLKVGHHGSAASLDEATAEALDPEVSVASAGEGNRYGHPDPACVEVLEGAGSLFLCTIDVGDVTVEPGEDGPRVSCQRAPPGVVLH